MVNFHDPVVIAKESAAIDKFWSTVDGIFIWEFFITLDYEWSVIRGHRPYRWTIWIYSLFRVATLAAVALNIYSVNVTTPINCQVIVDLQFILCYFSFAASSFLIALRTFAIWNKNRVILALVIGIWGINIAFLIQGASRFRSSWEVDSSLNIEGCVFHLNSIRLSTIVAFVADIIMFLIMLLGLYRLRHHHGMMGLGRFLWNQGVVWLLLAVVAKLTPMVFIILNLNGPMSILFHLPGGITMSIAAARMYRSLSDFLSSDVVDSSQKILPTSGRIAFETNGTSTAPIIFTGIKVVDTTQEQHFTPQANRSDSNISGKPHELTVDLVGDHDIENGAEKRVM